MDAARRTYWMVRDDTDPPGLWRIAHSKQGDWAVKIGSNKGYALRRIAVAKEMVTARRKCDRKLMELRPTVDKMRRALVVRGDRLERVLAACRFT